MLSNCCGVWLGFRIINNDFCICSKCKNKCKPTNFFITHTEKVGKFNMKLVIPVYGKIKNFELFNYKPQIYG